MPAPLHTSISPLCPSRDEEKASQKARRAALARRDSGRRRFVDPTTCERDYTEREWEFLRAIEDYKRSSGRMFPTWSEVLGVVRSLGYEKAATSGEAGR